MIKFQISALIFIASFISTSTIFASDTLPPEAISSRPTHMKHLSVDVLPESLSNNIFSKKEPFSHEEKIHLVMAFLNDHTEIIVDFFKDRSLMDYYEYLEIIKGMLLTEASKNSLEKEIKLHKLAAAFTQQEISSPFLKEMSNVKAAMAYSASLEHTKADALLDTITNKQKNNEILYAQTMIYFASGNLEKCLNYGKALEKSHSFCDEKAIPALTAFLKACYYLENEELATTTVTGQFLSFITKDYSLKELANLYHFFWKLVPYYPARPYILDDLRDLAIAHFTSKLTETHQEAQYLFKQGKLEEAKSKFEECCRNPFATLNILSDYYIVELLLGVRKPSVLILSALADKVINKNDFNFNEVIRTLGDESPQVKQEKFIQELNKLYPEMQKVFLYEKEVSNKDQTFFKEYFQTCLGLVTEQTNNNTNTLDETNSLIKAQLKSDNSEKGRPKRKKKNRKKSRSSQHVMEEKTSSSSLDSSSEKLQDTKIDNLNQQTVINEEKVEDKEAEKINPTPRLVFPSPLSHSLSTEGELAELESLELLPDQSKEALSSKKEQPFSDTQNNIIVVEQDKNETEETILAHFMDVPKEELIGFIFELHSKAKKIQSNADNLTVIIKALSEENNRLIKENQQLKQKGNDIKN
ncbi:hypothetical protein [Candidatus Paracaedibacter symbiosus]|uniref:hypothetical protein n=1 Tax=Candidatus Paracaedibacter symbiosus TaxID=244582 RepID=UPI000509F511|nr:hypothetical protein [Candidatus Paracaedibacter symbiosus]